jgi:hypothetical protein
VGAHRELGKRERSSGGGGVLSEGTKGLWARVLEPGGEKRVAGGAMGEVAGGVGAFYRARGEGAEAVRRELGWQPLMAPFRVGDEMGRGNREPGR